MSDIDAYRREAVARGDRKTTAWIDSCLADAENREEPAMSDKERPDFAQAVSLLADVPPDVIDAYEAFSLAILRHQMAGWKQIGPDQIVGVLWLLIHLANRPAEKGE